VIPRGKGDQDRNIGSQVNQCRNKASFCWQGSGNRGVNNFPKPTNKQKWTKGYYLRSQQRTIFSQYLQVGQQTNLGSKGSGELAVVQQTGSGLRTSKKKRHREMKTRWRRWSTATHMEITFPTGKLHSTSGARQRFAEVFQLEGLLNPAHRATRADWSSGKQVSAT